ncbi:aspartate--ammonia ligase [Paenibacillus sp. PK3_47]|uniref:aspartate--ammonia ligase n=1 Tax=Paenibacillus sp. PK3_47 TaxID=2072642 RepID=UPI00201D688F|nr:aspartate--ammonia ligase [Paenibacillus sp. PK3_47]UQZ36790.1 aspartate--ammonia ligase [Paenibacillus sp. PK3_47]
MPTVNIPKSYESLLNLTQTEKAIKLAKELFEAELSEALNLQRVSAPLVVRNGNGINDNLNGVERIVSFDAIDITDGELEIVQSLAKWKRMALQRYNFKAGEGLYTIMNALRRDEIQDNLHSIYVDQWDWEKVIPREQRNLDTLKSAARSVFNAVRTTEQLLSQFFPELTPVLPEKLHFITSQELEYLYPDLTPKERENRAAQQYGAVFIMQIGGALLSGIKHDGRAPDYDDWNLNGDIVLWYPVLEQAFEISSMGIRVDKQRLAEQLELSGDEDRKALEFHQLIFRDQLPQSIGGGIGQSRVCMFLLKKAHIGEVQASVWNEQILKECREGNINLL